MNVLLLATAFLSLASPLKAPIIVHVDAKSGDSIAGEHTFKVTVESQNLVTQVEFYLNDDLRDKATSTPYRFTIDGLNETEGDAKLRFKAYTSEGETGEAAVTVKIDNGLSKGADFHVNQGKMALQDGKWDSAITSGRIALKIDPKSSAARMIVARAYQHKNVFDKAQKYAEDVVSTEPNNANALDLLAVISLQRAFTTFNSGSGDKNETLKTIGDALKSAVDSRRKALDYTVDHMPSPTPETVLPYVDAALRAGRYSLAINELSTLYAKAPQRNDLCNRIAFAQIRIGRYNDALITLSQLKKNGTLDAYGQATMAVVLAETGHIQASDEAIKDAILSDADSPIVSTAQAYIALKFVRNRVASLTSLNLNYDDLTGKDTSAKLEARNTLTQILRQLARDQGQRTEVNYYLCALNNKLENFDTARKYFEQAVLTEPTNYDAYIEQGNKSITISTKSKLNATDANFLYDNARTMYIAALDARPNSAAALVGLCLVAGFEDKPEEAIKWGTAAVNAEITYVPSYVALSTAYALGALQQTSIAIRQRDEGKKLGSQAERQDNEQKARAHETIATNYSRLSREALSKATSMDKRIEGAELSKPLAAWRYFNVGGRVPVLPMPN